VFFLGLRSSGKKVFEKGRKIVDRSVDDPTLHGSGVATLLLVDETQDSKRQDDDEHAN